MSPLQPMGQENSGADELRLSPQPNNTATIERIEALLSHGYIGEGRGRVRWSSNFTFLVSVCDDELKTLAIYKPQRGERPLWDFPDGTLCYREKAAWIVSEALGWRIVPPTILREGPRGLGSIQLFVEHNPEVTYFNLSDYFTPQLKRIAAFDFITNNADRKGGHCLLDSDRKVWGIDHGLCFHVAPKLRTVIWDYAGKSVPEDIITDVAALRDKICNPSGEIYQTLLGFISQSEITATIKRIERLLKQRTFPEPGHGPSYPWPPV